MNIIHQFNRIDDNTLECKIYEPATDRIIVTFTWKMVNYLWANCQINIFAHNLKNEIDLKIAEYLIFDQRLKPQSNYTVEFVVNELLRFFELT